MLTQICVSLLVITKAHMTNQTLNIFGKLTAIARVGTMPSSASSALKAILATAENAPPRGGNLGRAQDMSGPRQHHSIYCRGLQSHEGALQINGANIIRVNRPLFFGYRNSLHTHGKGPLEFRESVTEDVAEVHHGRFRERLKFPHRPCIQPSGRNLHVFGGICGVTRLQTNITHLSRQKHSIVLFQVV